MVDINEVGNSNLGVWPQKFLVLKKIGNENIK